jgi:hypothetical protein
MSKEKAPESKISPPPLMSEVQALIAAREKTHGSFSVNAHTYRNLSLEMNYADEVDKARGIEFTDVQKLALDQILLKLARIKFNPQVREHWLDIQGYAKLVCDDLSF